VRGDGLLRRLALGVAVVVAAAAAVPIYASAGTARTLHLGDAFKVTGFAAQAHGAQATGLVVVRGRWAGGPSQVLTTTRTDGNGHYSFTIKPTHRGVLTVQITPPDRQTQQFVLRVV
jgi:hypothetical protein